jgi:hypothetical protein
LWLPNERLAWFLEDGEFDSFDQNFRQAELEWNHGASQQDEKELKELYLDLELFDSRLWLRIGKQNIVWGKTELFRITDQFNPQDLALASLPSLEESRIALWALRAVWSFYKVGPLEDVRFEVAVNYDQFEPADLGRCGEPYSPLPVCLKTYGLMASGFTADGIAGEIKPPNPWNSWKGIEVGGRLEWRYERFSFALTDFYGYNDGPYRDPLMSFSRNVDPRTGRPRWGMSTGICKTGREPACLTSRNALTHHSVKQQQFHYICANTIGFSDLDPTTCGQTIFNSQDASAEDPAISPRVMIAFTNMMSGQPVLLAGPQVLSTLGEFTDATRRALSRFPYVQRFTWLDENLIPHANTPTPLVPLVADWNDGGPADLTGTGFETDPRVLTWRPGGLQPFLTDEQEALLGCGPFYGTQCDVDGIDLMNIEASSQLQSWTLFDGTFGPGVWLTTDASRAQPGTVGFRGGPACTRYENGRSYILPGCRGRGDRGYDPAVDGTTGGAVQPFTGQRWASEMAIVSWNLQMALVVSSTADVPGRPTRREFDPNRPFRSDGCSFAAPAFCKSVSAYNSITGAQRNSVRAGGNGRYGRRDFIWHGGGNVVLRYEKRNVLGFSADFAEDVTKSNWGVEFAWIEGVPFSNNNAFDANSEADTFNLTVSVDRPWTSTWRASPATVPGTCS